MGFSTYDELIAALSVHGRGQLRPFQKTMVATGAAGFRAWSSWRRAGLPAAGSDPSALTARQVDSSLAGALSFDNPGGGRTLHLTRIAVNPAAVPIMPILVDRLLDYGALQHNSNSVQNLTNGVALPRYADGKGVMAYLEVTTALGATAQNFTMTYTNEEGVGGRTSVAVAMRASSLVDEVPEAGGGNLLWIPLQAGDRGVRSVESVQFSAANSAGVSNLVLCRPIIELPGISVGVIVERDMVPQGPSLERLYDGAALQWVMTSQVSGTPNLYGSVWAAEN